MSNFDPNSVYGKFEVDVDDILTFSDYPIGVRRMVPITGGDVSGAMGSGRVLTGTDWQWLHEDGTIHLSAHYAIELQTPTGVDLVEVESNGLRVVAADGTTYFKTVIRFTAPKHRTDLNHRLFIAHGKRESNRVVLDLVPVS
jgi:hypothetical protein